ncbi:hypothetical protein [Angustibacter luteus]|uniref:Secreted protein n=1 Tax=Angustibacter luteus TaxID=658456 RepID=A0ABW1JFD1_9ACTN
MNRSRKLAITLALAAGVGAPLGVASSAQAVGTVTKDGCHLTVDKPAFTNHWTAGGLKQADYVYHLTCDPSLAGVSVEITHERWESDLAGAAGDPDALDEFTGTSTQNKSFPAAGATKDITVRAALPVTDDTDGDEEVYQKVRFRVTNQIQGGWSAWNLSQAQSIQN